MHLLTPAAHVIIPPPLFAQPVAVMVGCAAYVLAKLRGMALRFSDVERVCSRGQYGGAPLCPGPASSLAPHLCFRSTELCARQSTVHCLAAKINALGSEWVQQQLMGKRRYVFPLLLLPSP
jgi:hypothetical protein